MKITKEFLLKIIKEELENEGDYDNMTRGLDKMGAIAYEVVDESGREDSMTFTDFSKVEKYLKHLDSKGADLYDITIKPKFK